MKNASAAFLVGLLFALGLGISGMTQVEKVIGFLDVFGSWEPTLMFVMMGAIAVHLVAYRFIIKSPHPLFDTKWHLPERKDFTAPLVIGSALFGIGWGLGGFCPGPALVSLASIHSRPLIFVISMIVGMLLFRMIGKRLKSPV
jgi:uncharacterized membrane protein YedE/YeeE